jgi:hypothetical protein
MTESEGRMSTGGCSTPLGAWLEVRWPDAGVCCLLHDAAYAAGGDARDRLRADLRFFI